jgi:hypothetical protein
LPGINLGKQVTPIPTKNLDFGLGILFKDQIENENISKKISFVPNVKI